ncbi:MAG: efflux RND transporter periplasmic adaptor subunit [Bryobacteraceae bacterium]|nr:efflux RND transporter periplasmic adaptor subunit [Bryobacteraceae bacterium]
MRRLLVLLAVLVVAAVALWLAFGRSRPPEVALAKVERQTIESILTTNGRVEPVEWASARAARPGLIESLSVERGQQVARGAVLATMDASEARAALAAAEARIEQARATLTTLERGGSAAERATIEGELAQVRLDRQTAEREVATLGRLVAKRAATEQELTAAKQRVAVLEAREKALEAKRSALVVSTDREVAQAQLRDAQAAAALAREQIESSTVKAPIAGTVYGLEARVGSFLNAGDLVASIGQLDRLRAVIYVDEPELGRVRRGIPVRLTWDALPGREWKGYVDRLPTQVVAQGTRQVGEVVALIDNPDRTLLPGTNVNAALQSEVVTAALSIPKEAIRRRGGEVGVFVLGAENKLNWRPVKLGASNVTRSQVVGGLNEGDQVALAGDRELTDGMVVTPAPVRLGS